jgi:hypothetical protein
MSDDVETKKQYHGQYFQYTLLAVKEHVDKTLREVDQLSADAKSKDVASHPRILVILQHNDFCQENVFECQGGS